MIVCCPWGVELCTCSLFSPKTNGLKGCMHIPKLSKSQTPPKFKSFKLTCQTWSLWCVTYVWWGPAKEYQSYIPFFQTSYVSIFPYFLWQSRNNGYIHSSQLVLIALALKRIYNYICFIMVNWSWHSADYANILWIGNYIRHGK